ncbi:MAG: hypothetical protein U0736_22370 [Gemmataceae bacterium]
MKDPKSPQEARRFIEQTSDRAAEPPVGQDPDAANNANPDASNRGTGGAGFPGTDSSPYENVASGEKTAAADKPQNR